MHVGNNRCMITFNQFLSIGIFVIARSSQMDFEPEVITLPWNDKLDSRYYIILLSCIPCIGVGAMTKADWPRKHHIAYHIIFSGGSVVYTYNVENCYVMLIPWFPKTNSPKPTATTTKLRMLPDFVSLVQFEVQGGSAHVVANECLRYGTLSCEAIGHRKWPHRFENSQHQRDNAP